MFEGLLRVTTPMRAPQITGVGTCPCTRNGFTLGHRTRRFAIELPRAAIRPEKLGDGDPSAKIENFSVPGALNVGIPSSTLCYRQRRLSQGAPVWAYRKLACPLGAEAKARLLQKDLKGTVRGAHRHLTADPLPALSMGAQQELNLVGEALRQFGGLRGE
jgi:hypothetical protein